MKSILTIILLLFGLPVFAQIDPGQISGITVLSDPSELYIFFWDKAIRDTVDTARVEVVYNLRCRQGEQCQDYVMMLEVGARHTKYYSPRLQLTDDIAMKVAAGLIRGSSSPGRDNREQYTAEELAIDSMAGKKEFNSEIWVDLANGVLTERCHDYQHRNLSLEYSEHRPQWEWQLLPESDSIAGYACMTAKAVFRGREWKVWFAPELPFNAGPWKFLDLPGLLLRAEDSQGDYVWEFHQLSQPTRPLVFYRVKSRVLRRNEWRKYMQRLHDSPLAVLGDNGRHLFYTKGARQLTNDWTIPYNSLELE